MHQNFKQAKLVGREGKPEAYYFPPQHNNVGNNFPYTFMGFEPGTTREQVRRCIADWSKGDNKITSLSRAYQLVKLKMNLILMKLKTILFKIKMVTTE